MRREFSVPEDDQAWLDALGLPYDLSAEGGVLRVVVYKFAVPDGYNVKEVNVNMRIDAGYPDSQIDMAYFFPPLAKANGQTIAATSQDFFDSKVWQRWSRHRTPANPWRPGIDNLSTHFELVRDWLVRELSKP